VLLGLYGCLLRAGRTGAKMTPVRTGRMYGRSLRVRVVCTGLKCVWHARSRIRDWAWSLRMACPTHQTAAPCPKL